MKEAIESMCIKPFGVLRRDDLNETIVQSRKYAELLMILIGHSERLMRAVREQQGLIHFYGSQGRSHEQFL